MAVGRCTVSVHDPARGGESIATAVRELCAFGHSRRTPERQVSSTRCAGSTHPQLSLVADDPSGGVVGHILFTPVEIRVAREWLEGDGAGPDGGVAGATARRASASALVRSRGSSCAAPRMRRDASSSVPRSPRLLPAAFGFSPRVGFRSLLPPVRRQVRPPHSGQAQVCASDRVGGRGASSCGRRMRAARERDEVAGDHGAAAFRIGLPGVVRRRSVVSSRPRRTAMSFSADGVGSDPRRVEPGYELTTAESGWAPLRDERMRRGPRIAARCWRRGRTPHREECTRAEQRSRHDEHRRTRQPGSEAR